MGSPVVGRGASNPLSYAGGRAWWRSVRNAAVFLKPEPWRFAGDAAERSIHATNRDPTSATRRAGSADAIVTPPPRSLV